VGGVVGTAQVGVAPGWPLAAVGLRVVGLHVGPLVGDPVGGGVGWDVGPPVGDVVGAPVGPVVGAPVGLAVGPLVGAPVGDVPPRKLPPVSAAKIDRPPRSTVTRNIVERVSFMIVV